MQQDYPEDWANPSIQELYTQLNKTLSESKPLPEYNVQAQVSSAYDDTSIPVGNDGHFDNNVLTGAADSNVKLEVALGEDNYAEVETLPSSGSINSSDATSAAELKSCPKKIFAFPREIVIFKVYSEPGINLKSAGLKFTLNNPSIGCITQPVYLCLFGSHKYQVAYGCVYIKPGLDTPVDTTITAKLNSGQSMNIFLEVIKKTASISGTVYTGGSSLIKGYVKSLGPKACCKIDSSGNYSLPKVFRGHSRSVIATWWTSENGQKVRHREEKIINFFNADVAGFYFGVPPTPTPTATPTIIFPTSGDEYHDYLCAGIITQKQKWQKELGYPEGIKRTIEWINGTVTEPPLPLFIKEGIAKADVDGYNPYIMFLFFKDGYETLINDSAFEDYLTPVPTASFTHTQNKQFNNSIIANTNQPGTLKNFNVLLLGPAVFDRSPGSKENEMFSSIADHLTSIGYNVAKLAIENTKLDTDGEVTFHYQAPTYWDYSYYVGEEYPLLHCEIKDESKVMRPKDFENMDAYGIIYIYTHGYTPRPLPILNPGSEKGKLSQAYLMTCPAYERKNSEGDYEKDELLKEWEDAHPRHWYNGNTYIETYNAFSPIANGGKTYYYKALNVRTTYFAEVNKDFSGSLVYLNACYGFDIYKDEEYNPFKNAKIFVGPQNIASKVTASNSASSFFKHMLGGIPYSTDPLNAREAYNQVIKELPDIEPLFIIYGLDYFYFINIDTGPSDINDNTYLPGNASITVHKKGDKL
ncbi:MAG: hypothetical protein ABRQ37_11305 [Candidatus Eremiobacterota bacterium]